MKESEIMIKYAVQDNVKFPRSSSGLSKIDKEPKR